jgi:WD40 repeat protein
MSDARSAGRDSGSPLTVVNLSRGAPVVDLPALSGPFALNHASHGAILAARRADDLTRVDVLDVEAGRRLGELIGHTDNVYAIAYSPDGKRIATAGRDSLRLWDAESSTEIVQLRGHTSFIWCLVFSPDGSQLASGSGDRTVRLWNAPSNANAH